MGHCYELSNLSWWPGALPIAGRPVLIETQGALHIYVRSTEMELIEWYKEIRPGVPTPWKVFNLSTAHGAAPVASDPAPIMINDIMQVFAVNNQGRMLQWYKAPNPAPWFVNDLSNAWGAPQVSADAPVPLHTGATHLFAA